MINLLLPLLMIFFLKKKHSAVVLLEEFSRYKINNMASFVKTIKLADKKNQSNAPFLKNKSNFEGMGIK